MELLDLDNYCIGENRTRCGDAYCYNFLRTRVVYILIKGIWDCQEALSWDCIKGIYFQPGVQLREGKVPLGILFSLARCRKIMMPSCIQCKGDIYVDSIMFCMRCHVEIERRYRDGLGQFMLIGEVLSDRDVLGVVRGIFCAVL